MSDGDKGGGGPSRAGVSFICLALFNTSVILEEYGHRVRPLALFYNAGPTKNFILFSNLTLGNSLFLRSLPNAVQKLENVTI